LTQTFFVSDLHLCQERPRVTQLFLEFLANQAPQAQVLYILGDLFEYWAGDDDIDDPHHRTVIAGMRALSESGCAVYVMHGNRDFLMAADFAEASGAKLLPDPLIIDLHGTRALLTHGDMQCTDDKEYQAFRARVRDPRWQQEFLAFPLALRKAQIEALRSRSEQEKAYKSAAIMDVNEEAVIELLREYDFPPLLIHGHTHRPALHRIEVDGKVCQRIVLADWGDDGSSSYLECSATGCVVREIRLGNT
jgi:UDP-2,3-diacylglucosamine hydrolase